MTQSRAPIWRRWAVRLSVIYLLITIAVVVWFWFTADRDVLPTLLLFGPRWLALTPLLLLFPWSLITVSRWGLICCLIAACVIAGPFMGGVINFSPRLEPGDFDTFRIMTFNADNKAVDRERFRRFIQDYSPDVIALQDADRILESDFPVGYQLHPGTNGIKLAARERVEMVDSFTDPAIVGPARGAVKYTVGERKIGVVHLPTPRPGLEAVLSRKPNALETLQNIIIRRDRASRAVRDWLGPQNIVLGDFNMPVESVIYRRDWGDFQNAFNQCGLGFGGTMFTRRESVRIDHILTHSKVPFRSVLIGPDLGSAHRPLLAE